MAISLAVASVIGSVIKEGFKFGGTYRKEAIGAALTPTVIAVYSSMSEACAESCTLTEALFAPSGTEYAALILGIVAMFAHLNQKRKESLAK